MLHQNTTFSTPESRETENIPLFRYPSGSQHYVEKGKSLKPYSRVVEQRVSDDSPPCSSRGDPGLSVHRIVVSDSSSAILKHFLAVFGGLRQEEAVQNIFSDSL